MAVQEPIDPRVRLAISQWPDDAPRGAASTFCTEHGISRKSLYELRTRARTDGPAAVLEPRSGRPRSTPSTVTEQVKTQAVTVRAALDLPPRRCRPPGAAQEAALGVAAVRLRRRRRPTNVTEVLMHNGALSPMS